MNKTALERAFEIARTGACETVEDIRRQLGREGFDRRQVEGRMLGQQLLDVSRKARQAKPRDLLPSARDSLSALEIV